MAVCMKAVEALSNIEKMADHHDEEMQHLSGTANEHTSARRPTKGESEED